MDEDLALAAALWTGRGTRSWPHRDDAALVGESGEARGRDLLATLLDLEADFSGADADLVGSDLRSMTDRAAERFRSRHPDAPTALVDALAWCYSFDWN